MDAGVDLHRRLVSETFGTTFLLAAIVGSVVMAERLAEGNVAILLLASSLAIGSALFALISVFSPISGAHLNPAVTLAVAAMGGMSWRDVPGYIAGQIVGAFIGVAIAHAMFELPLFTWSQQERNGPAQLLSEFVSTFGLFAVIWGCARRKPNMIPFAVGTYIIAACWFTSSTSFANPAVTLARSATDTLAGIRPLDVSGFIAAELVGAGAATALFRWLVPVARPIDVE